MLDVNVNIILRKISKLQCIHGTKKKQQGASPAVFYMIVMKNPPIKSIRNFYRGIFYYILPYIAL